ncbi:Leucine-rich repeat-containing protein 4-like protein [Leptotrombidium deliense]|uniref:Leucine-rich repeat-containing protein 4-like protein n=1 Tax=Leptotrombidium deliense TaxID=299467 RepID=A0A443SNI7_9ACAR|nr:Leucine-rich repeat-containing protein 4-like protein [Leptotrombidium deliense]
MTVLEWGFRRASAQNCPSMCSCLWKNNKQTALCVNQGLISIPSGINPSTQVLDLNKNNFQILPAKVFEQRGLVNLQKVFLSECKLGVIAPDAFSHLHHLIELYLSSNLLTTVPSEALKHCPLVRRLQLNNNPIQAIRENSFDSLSHLMSLDLSNCEIDLIEPKAFRGLTRLQFLKLDNNRLTTLSPMVVNDLPPLYSFDLHRNPWNCDCELRASREWMYKYNVPQSIPPTCNSPERLQGSMWNSLDIDDFACKPIILNRDTETSAYSSGNTSFTCTVKAIPEARVSWHFADVANGNQSLSLTRNEKYFVTEDRSTFGYLSSTLNIINVDTTDAALNYRCFAENQAGSATKKFNLTLIALPYTSFNGWSKVEIACSILAGVFLTTLLCVFIILCMVRRTRYFSDKSKPVKTTQNAKQNQGIDKLNTVKAVNNSHFDDKNVINQNGALKMEFKNNPVTSYAYTPEETIETMNTAVENSFNNSYDGLLQVSQPMTTDSYNHFEDYDLYDYNNETMNYNFDTSFVNNMPLASGQHIDPNYWSKASSQPNDSDEDLHQSSSGTHPSQHHVNVVGQGSYNIGHPTVVRYSPDEGYAEEPAVIPYNLQGTEV